MSIIRNNNLAAVYICSELSCCTMHNFFLKQIKTWSRCETLTVRLSAMVWDTEVFISSSIWTLLSWCVVVNGNEKWISLALNFVHVSTRFFKACSKIERSLIYHFAELGCKRKTFSNHIQHVWVAGNTK